MHRESRWLPRLAEISEDLASPVCGCHVLPSLKLVETNMRRLPRFRLRTLLLMVILCCLVLTARHLCIAPFRHTARVVDQLHRLGCSPQTQLGKGPTFLAWLVGKDDFATLTDVLNYPIQLRDSASDGSWSLFDLRNRKVDDRVLQQCAGMHTLRNISLIDSQVTDEGLRYLEGLRRLRSLTLSGTQVTSAGMHSLRTITSLESLALNNTLVDDQGLATLSGLPNLKAIYLSSTRITAAGLTHLQNFPKLEKVALKFDECSDHGGHQLAQLKNLRHLVLEGPGITDQWCEGLGKLTELETFFLSDTGVTSDGLARLGNWQQLRQVTLCSNKIDDHGFQHMANWKSLESLTMYSHLVSDAELSALGKLPNLKRAKVDGPAITVKGLTRAFNQLPKSDVRSSAQELGKPGPAAMQPATTPPLESQTRDAS